MKTGFITVFKKEIKRFFSDRRTLASILLPGILIYVIYSVMGSALGDMFATEDNKPYVIAVNLPDSVYHLIDGNSARLETVSADEIEATKSVVENDGNCVLAIFPENFDMKVAEYNSMSGTPAPNVEIYYNSTNTVSQNSYAYITSLLSAYESIMTNKFDINNSPDKIFDLASEEDISTMMFSMMMPMLLVMLLFSGCMAVAPESIAGEKERGTIASMLITPTKRSHIAIGKILALAVVAIVSGTSSTIGIIAALPKLMQMDELQISSNIYGVTDYILLAAIVLSTALLFVTMISIISAYAKSVKEAASMVSPLMILVMVVGVSGMFKTGELQTVFYLIPVYNSVQSIVGIFSLNTNIINILITIGANALFTAGGIFLLTKMFDSEKIMFNK